MQRCKTLGLSWIFGFLVYETNIQPNVNNAAPYITLPPSLALPAFLKNMALSGYGKEEELRHMTVTSRKTLKGIPAVVTG